MADIRIKDLTTTASSTASDDFFAADGTTNGTRKLSAYSPSFGGNATVGGTLTVTGLATATSGVQINGGSFAAGKIYHDAAAGLVVAGKTGSTNDFLLTDPTGAFTVLANLTGTANLITGGTFKVNATTASTTTSSGALVVGNGTSGGLGVGGAIWAGGGASIAGTPTLPAAWTGGYGIGLDGALTNRRIFFGDGSGYDIRFSTRASSTTTDRMTLTDTGNLTVGGALTVSGTTTADGLATSGFFGGSKRVIVGYNTSSDYGFIASVDTGVGWKELQLNPSGGLVKVPSTTASTSTSSGALVVSGGVGVAGSQYLGVKLNISTHTGDSGGIGFGTETNLYRYQAGGLALDHASGAAPGFLFRENGTSTLRLESNSGVGYLSTLTSANLILRTNATTALTLDTSQNAIFAGTVRTAAPSGGTAASWKLGSVATVSPTSPNRTIEVDIGGTIYYIHAKTTNN